MTGRSTIPETRSPLPLQRLGLTDMHITRVGFGAWAIGGADWVAGWGRQDDSASIASIRHAIDRGINWIDTAAVYGLGHSEQIVRQSIDRHPGQRTAFCVHEMWDPLGRNRSHGHAQKDRRRRQHPRRGRGLPAPARTERIDLYQMHWPPDDGTPLEEYWQTLLDLKAEGKVRAVGLSNHDTAQLEAAERLGHVDTLQPPFSAIHRDVATAELPWCRAHDTGVIVYSPMASGLLTGAFTVERAKSLPKDDWRSRSADFTGDGLPAIWKSSMRCGRSRRDMAPASRALRSHGPWHGPLSPPPSSAPAARRRSTDGSMRLRFASRPKTSRRSPPRLPRPAPAVAPSTGTLTLR